jgi:hypothetical protein
MGMPLGGEKNDNAAKPRIIRIAITRRSKNGFMNIFLIIIKISRQNI